MITSSAKRTLTCIFISLIWLAQILRGLNYQSSAITDFRSFWDSYYAALAYGLSLAIICFLLFYLNKDKGYLTSSKRSLSKQILFGIPAGVIITAAVYLSIGQLLELYFPEGETRDSPIVPFVIQSQYLPFWILLSVIKGGFAEELFRVSALHHFSKSFGKKGLYFAAIVGSIVYGFLNYHQGWDAFINNGCRGLLFAGLYIWRGSATELIVAHSFRDIITIIAGYFLLQ